MKNYIPNILTLLRFPMAFFCAFFAINLEVKSLTVSLVLFALASITDFLDGYLARKWNLISNFGKIADPIADKALTLGVMLAFAIAGIFPYWALIIIAFREISITIVRLMLLPKKVVLAAIYSGKLKTVSQIAVLILIYLLMIFKASLPSVLLRITLATIVTWTVIITVYSGYEFYSKNIDNLKKLGK